ncbi:acyl-CoA dehydrogenase [Fomitiporia mediterranea MF3/22]|uniref:acyl-CoA dehydrogenase n=1 Tax=Fomitiporia mediterranea (strain MF3/22) TaxID=694068 RepID=UPI0004408FF8|nr:acyl-CoA dehydrogenase [Fomitiporia mediterranea MF3/22]EJD00146.1 acyl-CoA dehydrogenase [Fomitiporia mediterranea MF3/22]
MLYPDEPSSDSLFYRKSHHRLRAWLRSFLEADIFPYTQKWEDEGKVPKEAYDRMAQKGLLFPFVPRKYRNGANLPIGIDDDEWDLFHSMVINEELARAPANGPIWALTSGNNIGCPPIRDFGSEEQRMEYLPRVYKGEISFCLAITEPGAGSDVANISTTALVDSADASYLVVNGRKKWITNGLFADYATTLVRTSDSKDTSSLSLLIVPLKTSSDSRPAGLTIRWIPVSGLKSSGTALIVFKDVRVPRKNIIGKVGTGFSMVMRNFNPERLALSSTAIVLARTCLSDSLSHAMRRETFGKALIENQVIRAKIAGMVRTLESARAWYESIVWEIEQFATRAAGPNGKDYPAAFADSQIAYRIALLKVQAGRALELLVREAQQIFGGAGTTREGVGAVVEQISRDMRVWVVGGGSEEILDDLGVRLMLASMHRNSETTMKNGKAKL